MRVRKHKLKVVNLIIKITCFDTHIFYPGCQAKKQYLLGSKTDESKTVGSLGNLVGAGFGASSAQWYADRYKGVSWATWGHALRT